MKRFDIGNYIYAMVMFFIFTMAQQKIAAALCPCDIYAAGGTPCVAAHSMVRALYQSYNGPLYQVRRASDKTTKDIYPVAPGGVANAASQDSFLTGTTGKVSIIYDQTSNGNKLTKAPAGSAGSGPDNESSATGNPISLGGQSVYGLYMNAGDGYRNDSTKNVATTIKPEGVYWVVNGKHYNGGCCWDYGNAETNNSAGATGLMNCLYFGNISVWGSGTGNGPWMMGDFEAGIWSGGSGTYQKGYANCPTITWNYVTGMLKEQTTNSTPQYALKCANADSGGLRTIYTGNFVTTWKLQGAIILGIGGDNSKGSAGTFYEGALTTGWPPDTTEDAVQANIVAAGFGRTTTSTIRYGGNDAPSVSPFTARYNPSNCNAVISYTLQGARRVRVQIIDQRGRRIAAIVDGIIPAGRHEAVWDAKRVPAGVYIWKIAIDGNDGWSGKVVIGK